MSRPSFHALYMGLAVGMAKRSTCLRLQVGCVIASWDSRQVYGVGYNGNYVKGPHDCDVNTPGACGDLHAEENAIINCSASRYDDKIVYVTHSPCVMCAKRLINLGGVVAVHYATAYRDSAGIELLESEGISCLLQAP